jgi:hypothetical protein
LTKRATGHIVFEEGFEKVLEAAKNAMTLLRISFVRENVSGSGQRAFWSWGEIVGIKISGNERGGSLVEAISECIWPLQIFDHGTNKKNLESLFAALKMQLRTVGPVHVGEKRWGSE